MFVWGFFWEFEGVVLKDGWFLGVEEGNNRFREVEWISMLYRNINKLFQEIYAFASLN